MKKLIILPTIFIIVVASVTSCSKILHQDQSKSEEFISLLVSKQKFKIKDMLVNDTSKYELETKPWLKDDVYYFKDSTTIIITQGDYKIFDDDRAEIEFKWSSFQVGDKVKFKFYNEFYRPIEYDVKWNSQIDILFTTSVVVNKKLIQTIYEALP